MNKRKSQLSLFHLHITLKDITDIVEALNINNPLSNTLSLPIFKYTIIRTCAFYDELNCLMKLLDNSQQRYNTLKEIQNFIVGKRDKLFPDLKNIRNNGLAHNFRIKLEGYRSIFEKETEYIFPISAPELIVNYKLMDIILASIKILYPEIHEIMNDNIHQPKETNSSINESNYRKVILEVSEKVERLIDKIFAV